MIKLKKKIDRVDYMYIPSRLDKVVIYRYITDIGMEGHHFLCLFSGATVSYIRHVGRN